MFSMIRQWQVSGISQIEFCKKKSVSYATFHYWYKKFRDSEVSEEVVSSYPSGELHVGLRDIFLY
jgi:hypothetical protein